jgi:hypothetical protein
MTGPLNTGVLLVLQGGINQTQERGLIMTQEIWAVIGVQKVLLVVEQERLRVQNVQWVNIAVWKAPRKQHHALQEHIRTKRVCKVAKHAMPARSRQREHRNARIVALVKKQMQQEPDANGVRETRMVPMVANAYRALMISRLHKDHQAVCRVVLPSTMDSIRQKEPTWIGVGWSRSFAGTAATPVIRCRPMATARRVHLATTATVVIKSVNNAHML